MRSVRKQKRRENKRKVRERFVHFTTVHPREDTRIRVKEIVCLAEKFGEPVALFVQDGEGDDFDPVRGLRVVDTGRSTGGRVGRMTRGAWLMFMSVRDSRPRLAHFHDPELIPVGLLLKVLGIKVIYDVHEDVPRQILGKYWIWPWLRVPAAWAAGGVERLAGVFFDGIVVATPVIGGRFPRRKTVVVQNFPILSELVTADPIPYKQRPTHFAYVGVLTSARGVEEMSRAVDRICRVDVRLQLAGGFRPEVLLDEMSVVPGWSFVDFLGWTSRPNVAALLGRVRAGLVVFHPSPNHLDAQPNKMFEYMAASLPVIASDFPLWREIVDGAGCGLLVDPLDPEAIAEAMRWILDNPEKAQEMGRRGRDAVETQYNWEPEATKLRDLYGRLLGE